MGEIVFIDKVRIFSDSERRCILLGMYSWDGTFSQLGSPHPDPDMLNINPLVLFFTDGMRVGDGIKFSISQGIQEEQPALKYHDADVSGIIFYFCLFNPQRMLCSDVVLMKKVE